MDRGFDALMTLHFEKKFYIYITKLGLLYEKELKGVIEINYNM